MGIGSIMRIHPEPHRKNLHNILLPTSFLAEMDFIILDISHENRLEFEFLQFHQPTATSTKIFWEISNFIFLRR